MSDTPRFTIITPTWNQAEYIRDTIESVLNQTRRDLEYIIVDNCSDDGTQQIVEEYMKKDPRIIYVREPDHGQAEAINKGLKRAKGSIVAWLNSDDIYMDEHVLARVDKAFYRHAEAGLIVGDAWYCDKNKKLTEYNPSDRNVPAWVIRRWYYIVQPAVFWKNEHALLDEKYHYVFDWKFFIEAYSRNKVYYSHTPYALYRMYEDNKTGQNNAKRKKEIWKLQVELGDSRLNAAWCKWVYKQYAKAEETGDEKLKKRVDLLTKVMFHLTFKRIVSF